MNDKEILKKAIEKAQKNKYIPPDYLVWYIIVDKNEQCVFHDDKLLLSYEFCRKIVNKGDKIRYVDVTDNYYQIIFSPEFAKAFFGDSDMGVCYKQGEWTPCCVQAESLKSETPFVYNLWEFHQHKMLNYIQEGKNPLKYFEEFLNGTSQNN